MRVNTASNLVAVQLPAYDGPAIRVARWPVPAPRDVFRQEMHVPAPKVPPWERYAFAIEKLLLPDGFAGRRLPVLPADVDDGLCPLWTQDDGSPLLLPVAVVRERVLRREWPIVVMATPSSVGVVAQPETLAEVAWAVVCRVPRAEIASLLAELSAVADQHRLKPTWLERLIRSMRPPPAVAGRLRGAARSGQPLLDPRCIRWVLREVVAVTDTERTARAAWATENTDARLVAHAWFPCLQGYSAPSEHEVLLAVWLLHETFHKTDMSEPSEQEMLSTVTMLGYRVGRPGSWLATLERWSAIWNVSDADPAVAQQRNPPSTLRSMYGAELGLPVDAWFSGVWALCLSDWGSGGPLLVREIWCGVRAVDVGPSWC